MKYISKKNEKKCKIVMAILYHINRKDISKMDKIYIINGVDQKLDLIKEYDKMVKYSKKYYGFTKAEDIYIQDFILAKIEKDNLKILEELKCPGELIRKKILRSSVLTPELTWFSPIGSTMLEDFEKKVWLNESLSKKKKFLSLKNPWTSRNK